MGRLGFYFDMGRCIACKTCQVACKDKNDLEEGFFFRRVVTCEAEENGQPRLRNYSGACNHCEEPGCIAVCPTGAMHKLVDGTVGQSREKCIGCGACVWNCPYGAPRFSKRNGTSQKCDACADLREMGKNPACVDACLTHCLQFGDMDEFQEKYGPGLVSQISILPEETLTKPSILIKKAALKMNRPETFLVLGGGVAGLCAAAAIREWNDTGRIILVGEEPYLPYSRPMLTKSPFLGVSTETAMHSAEWYEENRIETRLGCRVTALNPAAKTVLLANGEVLRYDKCVYALGAECFIPPIPGSEKRGVAVIRQREDVKQVRRMLLTAKRAVIIGGGVLGMEMAWELKKAGLAITVIEMAKTLMERVLDEETALILEEAFRRSGINLVTGVRIDGIRGMERVECVELSDGTSYPADFVILSCGIKPNVELAREAGVEVGRSVIVNERMETSVADLYACGDCAEYDHVNTGTWAQSEAQGRTAGANAARDRLEYKTEPVPLLIHAAGISVFSIGDMGKKTDEQYEIRTVKQRGDTSGYLVNARLDSGLGEKDVYEKYYFVRGKLTGAALIGDLSKMQAVAEAVKEGRETSEKGLQGVTEREEGKNG